MGPILEPTSSYVLVHTIVAGRVFSDGVTRLFQPSFSSPPFPIFFSKVAKRCGRISRDQEYLFPVSSLQAPVTFF